MTRPIFTATARRDLRSIWVFIAEDSLIHADRVEEAILVTCRMAADTPALGHSRQDIRNHDVRFLTVSGFRRYSIAYVERARGVLVLRIFHGAQDVAKMV